MRMRRKPWARPELAACPFCVQNPPALRGRWREAFAKEQPVHLDLGCGKGVFLAGMALGNPKINYIGVDIKSEVLALSKRNAERSFAAAGRPVENLLIFSFDISLLDLVFSPGDFVSRIYLNFPNPWPKERHKKRRLTHPRQLGAYRTFLADGGDILFKSDDQALYRDTLVYFNEAGFCVEAASEDFRRDFPGGPAPISEHEEMFSAAGLPIYYIAAKKQPAPLGNR
jgi:tRNA (guanine-N7-)-methyltransferase